MWNLIRDLGDGDKLVQCSECGYQTAEKDLPNECPNCGEVQEGMASKKIDLNRSSLDVKEIEPEVYEYERSTPVYKHWYFWVGIILLVLMANFGGRVALNKINSEPEQQGNEVAEDVTFSVPTGWSKVDDNTYTGPGEASEITVITCNVSRLDKVEDFGLLVKDLTGIEKVEPKEINEIDGRYMSWQTRKVVDGEEVFTDCARYVFIHKSKLYILTFKSTDGNPESFDTFLKSIQT